MEQILKVIKELRERKESVIKIIRYNSDTGDWSVGISNKKSFNYRPKEQMSVEAITDEIVELAKAQIKKYGSDSSS